MKWKYLTHTINGNMHTAAAYLTANHPEWDVVTMDVVGFYTIIVYREVI